MLIYHLGRFFDISNRMDISYIHNGNEVPICTCSASALDTVTGILDLHYIFQKNICILSSCAACICIPSFGWIASTIDIEKFHLLRLIYADPAKDLHIIFCILGFFPRILQKSQSFKESLELYRYYLFFVFFLKTFKVHIRIQHIMNQ